MQEVRWKEPEIINEIETRRALRERPQRLRLFLRHLILRTVFLILFIIVCAVVIFLVFAYFTGNWKFVWPEFRLTSLILGTHMIPDIFRAWFGTARLAGQCRLNKFGTTHIASGEYIAWRDIENYRFEACDDAPNLRVLIVEARGREAPLRLYYEGEQLEARISDAMQQGVASTRTIPQGTILT